MERAREDRTGRLRARTRAHSDQSCALLCDGAGELALLTPIMSVRSLPASHWLLVQVDSQTVLAAMAMRVSARVVAVAIALTPSLMSTGMATGG